MNPSPALVYLHGLNSTGASAKAARLREAFGAEAVAGPTYKAHRPHQAVATLREFFGALAAPPALVVGSSMGGFYGRFLAQEFRFGHLALINPALEPWDLLPRHLGEHLIPATGERYQLSAEHIQSTRTYAVAPGTERTPTTVFLDTGDEVIDYRIAERIYRGRAGLQIYPGGDHAFAHMDQAFAVMRQLL